MSERSGNKYEIIRQSDERANTTLIWRAQGEPIGASSGAGDAKFIRRALVWSAVALVILAALGFLASQNAGKLKQAYANLLIDQSNFSRAEFVILSLADEDAKSALRKKFYFACAETYARENRLADAIPLYRAAGDYPGAQEKFDSTSYTLASMYQSDGDFPEASEIYGTLGNYLDSVERYEACSYAYAKERLEYGYYDEAMRLFYALGSYQDASDYAKQAAAALSGSEGAGDLVSLLVGLTDEQLAERARLKSERDALPTGMIATGYKHTVARTESGTVLATGSNLSGQCNVSDWSNIVAVAAGAYHTVALRSDGTVLATGMNTYGQCNVGKWANVAKIYAGAYNTVGLTRDGKILNTGYRGWNTLSWRDVDSLSIGDYALCGAMKNGQPLSTHAELVTDAYFDLVSFDAATANSTGLKADGTLVSNGLDVSGMSDILEVECTANGVYALNDGGRVEQRAFSYAHLPDVSDWQDIVEISASATHIAGVTADGRVLSRGASDMGQCNTMDWILFTPVSTPEPTPAETPAP